jgi:hypothetical protein
MLDMHRWGLIHVGEPPGDPVAASRETPHGPLQWQILVPRRRPAAPAAARCPR